MDRAHVVLTKGSMSRSNPDTLTIYTPLCK
jgi:hypothetical protein